jgi:hypothetical protein
MMNQQNCEQYTEWMSLAQDGMLSSTQTRLLHGHMAVCPPCQTQWEAMTFVSQLLHAAPMLSPSPGFAERVQIKLEYRQERRRRGWTDVSSLPGHRLQSRCVELVYSGRAHPERRSLGARPFCGCPPHRPDQSDCRNHCRRRLGYLDALRISFKGTAETNELIEIKTWVLDC